MKWENLQKNLCPHCDEPLVRRESVGAEITCVNCSFHISVRRFEIIIKHRHTDGRPIVKMAWQNILKGNCPVRDCGKPMKSPDGKGRRHRCTACRFSISEFSLNVIRNDPQHPAHLFNTP